MKMKKLASLLLCGIMAGVIFAGCGSHESCAPEKLYLGSWRI